MKPYQSIYKQELQEYDRMAEMRKFAKGLADACGGDSGKIMSYLEKNMMECNKCMKSKISIKS